MGEINIDGGDVNLDDCTLTVPPDEIIVRKRQWWGGLKRLLCRHRSQEYRTNPMVVSEAPYSVTFGPYKTGFIVYLEQCTKCGAVFQVVEKP
jgi:hypothetical protein